MTEYPWSAPVRVEDVPETGLHLDLVADEHVRAEIARLAGVDALPRLEAVFDIVRKGDAMQVTGHVSGTVGQTCVVTLEPLENRIEEQVDLVFAPVRAEVSDGGEHHIGPGEAEPPEPLVGGVADLGTVATEFLLLGIDPYPRKPGAVFASPVRGADADGPFAALAALKERPKRGD
jgi:hypothetical protein